MMELTENQEAWLAALESGKYIQTHGAMNNGGAMCPLGVACDVSKMSHWKQGSYMGYGAIPPTCVLKWVGLNDNGVEIIILQNDIKMLTFNRIAKNIRSEPDLYFEK